MHPFEFFFKFFSFRLSFVVKSVRPDGVKLLFNLFFLSFFENLLTPRKFMSVSENIPRLVIFFHELILFLLLIGLFHNLLGL